MLKKIALVILAVAVSILITQIEVRTEPESSNTEPIIEQPNNNNLSVKQILEEVPKKYNINPVVVQRVAFCESSYRYNVKGDGGHAYGILQFHKPTFDQFEKKYGEDLDYYSSYDQAKLASQMIRDGYGSHWTCYTKIYSV